MTALPAGRYTFAVDDEFQGHGIGTRLVEQLAGLAAEAGIERFVAEVLQANLSMLRVFERVGFAVTRELEGGVVEIVFPLAPTESYRASVDTRDHLCAVIGVRSESKIFLEVGCRRLLIANGHSRYPSVIVCVRPRRLRPGR